jgi:hypothetical protein
MKRLILLAAMAGGVAAITGCQVSGDHHVNTMNRPAGYDLPYVATSDTAYTAVGSDTGSGTIYKGSEVKFDHAPDRTMTWQQALVQDGHVRNVHPADFEPAR